MINLPPPPSDLPPRRGPARAAAPGAPSAPSAPGLPLLVGIGCLGFFALALIVPMLFSSGRQAPSSTGPVAVSTGRPAGTPAQAPRPPEPPPDHDEVLTVSALKWQRTVQLEQLVTQTKEAWEGELPTGARVVSQSKAVHHNEKVQNGTVTKTRTKTERVQTGTKRVKTGVKDLGNGYFEDVFEDKPVYENRKKTETYQEPKLEVRQVFKTKYVYEIDRWEDGPAPRSSGTEKEPPRWPEVKLTDRQREGRRSERYTVELENARRQLRSIDYGNREDWEKFKPGATYTARVSEQGSVKSLGPAPEESKEPAVEPEAPTPTPTPR